MRLWEEIKDYSAIVLGLVLYTVGWMGFLLPNEIVTGGITGVSSLIYFGTGLSVDISYFTINAILLFMALKVLGFQYCIRTIVGVAVCTSLLSLWGVLIPKSLITGEPFMAAMIGAVMCGAGIGLVFISNGSTGGTDIIAAMVNKYKNISFAKMMLYIDLLIIACSYVLFQSVEKLIYSYTVMFVMTYTMDVVITGVHQSIQILIMSSKYEEIATHINQDIHRGVTVLDGMGWYSKQPRKVLMVLAKKSESAKIFRLIKSIDSNAFISQSKVVGVYGQGFDKIKG